ncbi:MAG: tail fiber domain-containing protein [Bacteroidetes bacterium]|nr:tail fiber domain-containing protein [Bacteroidota bacterium]
MSCLLFLVITTKSLGQSNVVSTTGVTSPGQQNVIVGVNAGASSSTNPASNFSNVFIGFNSGLNTANGLNTFVGFEAGRTNTGGDFNTFIGCQSGLANTTGRLNTFLGARNTGVANTTGQQNAFVGSECGQSNVTGSSNTFMGSGAGRWNTSGGSNSFFGVGAGNNNTTGSSNISVGSVGPNNGTSNIVMGASAGATCSGIQNLMLGFNSGQNATTGNFNTYLGFVQVPAAAKTATTNGNDASSMIALADGGGNQRLLINNNGYTAIGLGNNNIAQNMLEINATGAVAGTTGLRFRNFTNTNFTATATSSRRVLTVNNWGDVILVDDIGGGITNSCTTNFMVPVGNASGNLSCSQIYDNGTSVGIGTTSGFAYTYVAGDDALGTVPLSGTARLKVNGVTWSGGFYASSDKKFKKEIKAIDSPLEAIQKLEGKTYLWNRETNKEMNFDAGLHSGFIAQELEKVLPHLVATDEKGNKAVNYTELIPYLVEAIKEQQTQINDLKNQISENFKAQNQDLIELKNTKIISVSPNPSNDVISVSFNVDKSVQSAKLLVHDLTGNVLSSLNINDRDNNLTRTLQKDNFGKGIYIISLVINGKSIDTKKIIFN